MKYIKTPILEPYLLEPAKDWGPFVRFLEIAEDNYSTRQIDLFENAFALRYDRIHWSDRFGQLADAIFDEAKWTIFWGTVIEIDQEELESTWQRVADCPIWQLQLRSADTHRRGTVPLWLRNNRLEK